MSDIDARISAIPYWTGPVECQPLHGGLSNESFKVTHAGGLTPAKIERDLCLAHGIKMRLEDTAGTEITRAAQAQLAAATPLDMQLGSYSFIHDRPPTADGAPELINGMLHLNQEPGLGITPKMDVLGIPLAVYA